MKKKYNTMFTEVTQKSIFQKYFVVNNMKNISNKLTYFIVPAGYCIISRTSLLASQGGYNYDYCSCAGPILLSRKRRADK